VDAFESIAGYSISVDGWLYSFLEDSDKEFYKQKILDMVNDYNYFKGSASLEEKDRRFYNEDVVLW